jgi:transposase InsO family protein
VRAELGARRFLRGWVSSAKSSPGPTHARAYRNSAQRSAELIHWLHRYNFHRPHGSLKANTPISRLGLSEDNLLRLRTC